MLERKISNGKILSVMLGYEDPGCLTCMIYILSLIMQYKGLVDMR